jgi:HEAT repeat protein
LFDRVLEVSFMNWYTRVLVLCLALSSLPYGRSQETPVDVREFVREEVFPRSYAELAGSYDVSVVPQLIEMLNSPTEKANHARIAALLGIVGDERAADALIAFIERPVENVRLTSDEQDAQRWAIMSLGYLVNRNASERALTYLIEGLTPSVWRQRKVAGIASWASSYEEYDLRLSNYALQGLAMSGNPAAGQALRSLQQSPTSAQARFRNGLDSTLNGWLGFHEQVAARGLAGAYEHDKAQGEIARQQFNEEARRAREQRAEAQRLREAQDPR